MENYTELLSLAGMHSWEVYSSQLLIELKQCLDEGRDVEAYRGVVESVAALPLSPLREELADALFRTLTKAPLRKDYPYVEPSDINEIRAARPAAHHAKTAAPETSILRDKLKAAWLGRICGCLLGKPVEGWRSWDICALGKAQDNWPLRDYLRGTKELLAPLGKEDAAERAWINVIPGAMVPDDDTNYTAMAALRIVGRHGRDFTSADVASEWIESQPKSAYCTAERRAFVNFVAGILPPQSAEFKNPDREYIGAQIRGDYFGYINPGDPETAADMAWRDAAISHVKNGIYGEMFIAAMLARAAVSDDIFDIIDAGFCEIPEKCRLREAIDEALAWFTSGVSEEEAWKRLHEKYNENDGYDWVHTISNAEIVVLCLLYSGCDYTRGICMAVMQGFDTDCNGATVGSIIGMMKGTAAIGRNWTDPIHDTLLTTIFGCTSVSIDELTDLTMKHLG